MEKMQEAIKAIKDYKNCKSKYDNLKNELDYLTYKQDMEKPAIPDLPGYDRKFYIEQANIPINTHTSIIRASGSNQWKRKKRELKKERQTD